MIRRLMRMVCPSLPTKFQRGVSLWSGETELVQKREKYGWDIQGFPRCQEGYATKKRQRGSHQFYREDFFFLHPRCSNEASERRHGAHGGKSSRPSLSREVSPLSRRELLGQPPLIDLLKWIIILVWIFWSSVLSCHFHDTFKCTNRDLPYVFRTRLTRPT